MEATKAFCVSNLILNRSPFLAPAGLCWVGQIKQASRRSGLEAKLRQSSAEISEFSRDRAKDLSRTSHISRTANPTKLTKLLALLLRHRSVLLWGHKTATTIRCLSGGSLRGGATISRRLRRSKPRVSASLLSRSTEVCVNVLHPAAILGSTNLPNRKLTIGFLLRKLKLILASLTLLGPNLTKLLGVALDGRQSPLANRANKAGVFGACNTKPGLNESHVNRLTPAGSRINALFPHPLANASHPVREKCSILLHEFGHRGQTATLRNACRSVP